MTEQTNPYSAPAAEIVDDSMLSDDAYHPPKFVPLLSAFDWVGKGFALFGRDAGSWVLFTLVGGLLYFVLNAVPLVNYVNVVLFYVWVGGIWVALQKAHEGKKVDVSDLFEGFKQRLGSLVLLGVIYFVACVVAIVPVFVVVFMGGYDWDNLNIYSPDLWVAAGVTFVAYVAILLSLWFAPALIILNNVGVFKAIGLSFTGCLKNIVPIFIYLVISMVFFFLGSILLLLGLLVAVPVVSCMSYSAYRQIYID